MGDITDPNFKTKEQKLKDKKAKLKNKDGIRSKVLDARIKRAKNKHTQAMEKNEKYAMVEVKKTGEPLELPTFTVTYSKKDEDAGLKDGITTHKPTKQMIKDKLDSQKPKSPEKKGSVHYKTGPIQYQHSSNLRMDDMVTTVGPLQGSTDPSTQLEQASPMGKKSNIVQKMANKRALKKMDADYNGIPGVQKSDFEQFKNK